MLSGPNSGQQAIHVRLNRLLPVLIAIKIEDAEKAGKQSTVTV